jgi:hypothetical protein
MVVVSLQQLRDVRYRPATARYVEHGSHEEPNHVVKKSVRPDEKCQPSIAIQPHCFKNVTSMIV